PSKPSQDKSDEEILGSTKIYKTRSSKTYQEERPDLVKKIRPRQTREKQQEPHQAYFEGCTNKTIPRM
ncbi:17070_t:CDS:1, partial [Gigaspora margarita]